ncbi:MAG: choice-of-anchor J domain-containing protein [Ignavibacteria bacterium]|nr:choice-of-anchor J domain-containing protein [Ignavibacteria bacterium]
MIDRSVAVYLQEGFDSLSIPAGWSINQILGPIATWSVTATGTNPPIPPYSGSGQAKFNSYDAGPGEEARLTTPAIDLSAAVDPFLAFQMYHDKEFFTSLDSVYIEVSTSDSINGPWTIVHGLQRPRANNGWEKEAISLLAWIGASRVFVSLRGVSKFGNNIFVDEFRIADTSFHDIGAIALSNTGVLTSNRSFTAKRGNSRLNELSNKKPTPHVPALPRNILRYSSQVLSFDVIVQNFGTFSESTYEISWSVDSLAQTPVSNTMLLQRSELDTLILDWLSPSPGMHLITAWTSLNTDSNNSNDTARLTVQVLDSSVIFFEGFNTPTFPPAGWTVINRDEGIEVPWFRDSTILFLPFEGIGFAANNFLRTNGSYLDDYLITPAIPGVAQTGNVDSIVFWARSVFHPPPDPNYPDSLMILVSTSGVDTSSFTILLDYFEVPKTGWVRFGYPLTGLVPQNSTVHVAFRYLHYDGGLLGSSSDAIGIDAVNFIRQLPTTRREENPLPTSFLLSQNYPNPFNPTTSIEYQVPQRDHVSIKIFDLLGREVATLVNDIQEPGTHVVSWDASSVAGGVYFYRLHSNGFMLTRKMVLLR